MLGPCTLNTAIRAVPAATKGVQTIPAGESVVVVEESASTGLAELLWQGRAYLVFHADLVKSASRAKGGAEGA